MNDKDQKQDWGKYREQELAIVEPILNRLGYGLEKHQSHLGGERYLMQAVTTTSGRKLILLGHRVGDGRRVVIKATRDKAGIRELVHERECREVLKKINFAYQTFFSPEEVLFKNEEGYTLSIQTFIEQESPFLERPLKEQFRLALRAFKAQESAHATTYRHIKLIQKTFGTMDAARYLAMFKKFGDNTRAQKLLEANWETIERYCGFLTHVDFVPHNFRVRDDNIYLFDHSSLRFGNKYEGWARFLNFMTLYNPELEKALLQYVGDNRAEEELLSLKLMRIYRLGEIIWYYSDKIEKSSGDLRTLNKARVEFWSEVLKATLEGRELPEQIREEYKKTRDSLRSEEEKQRQIGLH